MGNCINLTQSPQKNIRVLVCNGGEEKFKASTKVRKIISGPYLGYDLVHSAHPNLPLPPNAKLLPAEVYVLIPRKDHLSPEDVERVGCRERLKVKIVITRKQLEFVVRNAKDFHFQISKINPKSSWHTHGFRKWQPSLATIQE